MVSLSHGVSPNVLSLLHSFHESQEAQRSSSRADPQGDLRLFLRYCAVTRASDACLKGLQVKWDKERHSICPLDEYSPVTRLQKFLHDVLSWYETHLSLHSLPPFSWLRRSGACNIDELIPGYDEEKV